MRTLGVSAALLGHKLATDDGDGNVDDDDGNGGDDDGDDIML